MKWICFGMSLCYMLFMALPAMINKSEWWRLYGVTGLLLMVFAVLFKYLDEIMDKLDSQNKVESK